MQDRRCAAVREHYADVTTEPERLWALCAPDIVFHVAGTHPLSGSYFGRDAVRTYLDAVRRVPGDQPSFTIASVLADRNKSLLLVEGRLGTAPRPSSAPWCTCCASRTGC